MTYMYIRDFYKSLNMHVHCRDCTEYKSRWYNCNYAVQCKLQSSKNRCQTRKRQITLFVSYWASEDYPMSQSLTEQFSLVYIAFLDKRLVEVKFFFVKSVPCQFIEDLTF